MTAAASLDPRLTEAARRQLFFRELNDRVAQLSRDRDASPPCFICECVDATCSATIELTFEEYAKVRAASAQFVAPGHNDATNEDVLERCGVYLIVRARSSKSS